jgi:hypothetical protein
MKVLATACCLLALAPLSLGFTSPATSFGRSSVKLDKFSNRGKCDGLHPRITRQTGNLKAGFLDALFGNAKVEDAQLAVTSAPQGVSHCVVTTKALCKLFLLLLLFFFFSTCALPWRADIHISMVN